MSVPSLNLNTDAVELTAAICDIESVSGNEKALADAIHEALKVYPHLSIDRDGDAIVARTNLHRAERVVIAGHIDTVPVANNLPTRRFDIDGVDSLWGRGTVDMKAGVAVQLKLAAELTEPNADITWIFYDHEEVDASLSGLGRLARNHPELLVGKFAVLCEPSSAMIEGGCNGTMRIEVVTRGVKAHSARPWMGKNAIHGAADVLNRLSNYEPAELEVDGLVYREALNAVLIRGGIATNVVPDETVVTVNFRFAPSRSVAEAEAHLRQVFDGHEVRLVDSAAGARPGLDLPEAKAFVAATGLAVRPKYGWTDVARFSALGVPAVNFGPADPSLAHTPHEYVPVAQLRSVLASMQAWLSA